MPAESNGGRYQGRRFAAFILAFAGLNAAFFFGAGEQFANYTMALGALYIAYAGSQGATDWKKLANGGQ